MATFGQVPADLKDLEFQQHVLGPVFHLGAPDALRGLSILRTLASLAGDRFPSESCFFELRRSASNGRGLSQSLRAVTTIVMVVLSSIGLLVRTTKSSDWSERNLTGDLVPGNSDAAFVLMIMKPLAFP